MNLSDATVEVKNRLQKQLFELGLPPELADDIIGHHTLVNYDKGATIALQGLPAVAMKPSHIIHGRLVGQALRLHAEDWCCFFEEVRLFRGR